MTLWRRQLRQIHLQCKPSNPPSQCYYQDLSDKRFFSEDYSATVSPFIVLEMFKKVEREKEEALKQAEFQLDIYQINDEINVVCEDNGRCGATDPGPRHL